MQTSVYALSCSNRKMFRSFQNLAAVLSNSIWSEPFSAIKKKNFPPHFPVCNKIYHPLFPFFFFLLFLSVVIHPRDFECQISYWWITLSNVSEIIFFIFSFPIFLLYMISTSVSIADSCFPWRKSTETLSVYVFLYIHCNEQCDQVSHTMLILYMCVDFK